MSCVRIEDDEKNVDVWVSILDDYCLREIDPGGYAISSFISVVKSFRSSFCCDETVPLDLG